MMNRQFILFLIMTFSVMTLWAKSESVLMEKVNLPQGTHNVTTILKTIEKQSQVRFAYDNSLRVSTKDVHLHKSDWKVKEVLDHTFRRTNISYVNKGAHVVLVAKAEKVETPEAVKALYTVSGTIIDAVTGEPLFGAGVQVVGKQKGASTDFDGNFSFRLEEGTYELTIKGIGYVAQKRNITLNKDVVLNIELSPEVNIIEGIEISVEQPDKNIQSVEMGTVKMDIEEIRKIPPVFGEVDIVKSIQTLPGVTTVGEGANGFNVRGGAIDQNLVLLDEAPIFSSSHLFGFFSVFNSDAVQGLELYKGSIPAQYGGRASSVLDVHQKEGDYEKFGLEGGIGVVSSRLTLQAPIVKDKASIIISGRRSYADLFLRLTEDLSDNQAYFYDLNTQITYKVNEDNRLFLSGYYGRDAFNFGDLFGFDWGNSMASLRWKHTFNDRFFLNTSALVSDYDYSLGGDDFFIWTSSIQNYQGKLDFTHYLGKKDSTETYQHKLTFGASSILYHFYPADVDFRVSETATDISLPREDAIESAIYVGDEWKVNSKFSMTLGLRYSSFLVLGGKDLFTYQDNVPKSVETITGIESYDENEIVKHYHGLEPRIGLKYSLDKVSSIKAGYNRARQYLQLVSNSTNGLPTDIWKPSDNFTQPLISDQVALGYFRNFKDNMYETSAEVYYKWQQNVLDYKNGADLFFNPNLEQELLEGQARAYGLELMVKKKKGKLTGRVSYTLSRAERQVDSEFDEERLNNGDYYLANQDKLHDLTVIASYEITKRFSLSTNFSYATGRPFTPPASKYTYQGVTLAHYELRNNDRIPDYHRLDLSATLKNKKKKPTQRWESSWNFSIYNVYGRRNAFSYDFQGGENGLVNRISILGTVIPAVSYNFKY
ncbi:MAG: TonB-dependent receptor [Cytophagales bacterium]|nr:TonB-dependent receptor [Cytophagales bacterium]